MDFPPASTLIDLQCPVCGASFDAGLPQTTCPKCSSPILARYDIPSLKNILTQVSGRARGLWRWAELLPVRGAEHRLTLGEGDTPLLPLPRLAEKYALPGLMVKDESLNPTGTIKARGLCVAVSKARELGFRSLVINSTGNAGGALAAYAARGGLEARVSMPADAPLANRLEVAAFHGDLRLIDNAEKTAAETTRQQGFDVSDFKEPYYVEGAKTLGFELADQMGWQLPDVMIVPTGGGSTLVGLWKAFSELEALGWISSKRPRMVSVQAADCAPVVAAFNKGAETTAIWENARTLAAGLRVPAPYAGRLILQALRQSGGTAVAVSDDEILAAQHEFAVSEGMVNAPEGAASLAALKYLVNEGFIQTSDRVVLVNTGTGLKYIDSQGGRV